MKLLTLIDMLLLSLERYTYRTILLRSLSGSVSLEYAFDGVCLAMPVVFGFGVLILEINQILQ
jgi:hypothetical protein